MISEVDIDLLHYVDHKAQSRIVVQIIICWKVKAEANVGVKPKSTRYMITFSYLCGTANDIWSMAL